MPMAMPRKIRIGRYSRSKASIGLSRVRKSVEGQTLNVCLPKV
jgi:hypothetical protein